MIMKLIMVTVLTVILDSCNSRTLNTKLY